MPMYFSTFPSSPATDAYLRAGRIIEPADAEAFAQQLGRAMDTARIVFSTPIMTRTAARWAGPGRTTRMGLTSFAPDASFLRSRCQRRALRGTAA